MFRYMLLDSSQHPQFHKKLLRWGVFHRSLFDGHAEEALPEIAPLLIDVTIECEATRKVTDEAMGIGKRKPCVSMLESTLPLVPLTEHFAQFHLAVTPDGRSLLMRWYDTRILPAWLDVLTHEQRDFFTHPVTQWISIDRFGIEQQHVLSRHAAEAPKAGPMPFQLNEAQFSQLSAAVEPDILIYELRKTISQHIDSVPHRVLYPFVHAYWKLAQQHGLLERRDQVHFVGLALCTSGRFVDHPMIAAWLARPQQSHGKDFHTLLNALPNEALQTGTPLWENESPAKAVGTAPPGTQCPEP
ncbi:DUF4123 domain-containing protein [Dyella monticola]|uniref:DUF4123 domain-containing protein n=1 Tax=Dyella monticola TaxID=1927958 RepID=A0A370WXL8_9GAMM|nr:DUF4123 domain-containing protein [Dyella monticola]RDS80889.1 DUF4123 domain-containing protein [Dyella monticola]